MGGSAADLGDRFPVDMAELHLRHLKLFHAMDEAGLERYLIVSGQLDPMGVNYASNHETVGGPSLVVLDRTSQKASLFVQSASELRRARLDSPLEEVEQVADLATFVGQQLRDFPRSGVGRLQFCTIGFQSLCNAAAGREIEDQSSVLERAARSKTPLELAIIRRSAELADRAFEQAAADACPGMADYELAAAMEYSMRQGGAFENFGLLAAGSHNRSLGLPSGRRLEVGDTLLFEITPAIRSRNYSAQLCRTLVLGEQDDIRRDRHRILEEAFHSALEIARPGTRVSELVERQDRVISSYGFAEYCRAPFMRARGHGFGIGRIDLSAGNHQVLEAGMAFIIHPNQYFPDVGYLVLGQTVILTEDGAELLSRLPIEGLTASGSDDLPAQVAFVGTAL